MQDEISKAAAVLGAKGGSVSSEAKATAARQNGKLGGDTRETYYLLSGEGECGTWSGPIRTTTRGIRTRATRERCHGDRWCRVFVHQPETETVREHLVDVDNGDRREVPSAKRC